MRGLLSLALCLGVSSSLMASTISYTGQWANVDANHDGFAQENWVFNLGFHTSDQTAVTFDMLASEIGGWNQPNVDFNHDGVYTFRDTMIRLYNANGGGTIAYNDDGGFNDLNGSIHPFDSFLHVNLPAGSWNLAIGQFWLTDAEAAQGYQSARSPGFFRIDVISDRALSGVHIDHGVATPEASTVLLTLAGTIAMGFGLWRRRETLLAV